MSDAPNPLQDLIAERLRQNSFFSVPRPVPIITADDGDIENAIEQKTSILNGGLALLILVPFGRNPDTASGVVIPELIVEVAVSENVIINRAATGFQKSAYTAIRKIAATEAHGGLHHWQPGPPFSRLEFVEFGEFAAKPKNSATTLLVYRAIFRITEAFE